MDKRYITLAQKFAINYSVHSTDNKAQFTDAWNIVKLFPKESRVAEVKLMKKASEATIKLNSARREYKQLLTMVENYATLPERHYNLTKGTFENLSRVMKLVVRLNKHYEGDMSKLAPLGEVYTSDMSAHRYNNEYEKAVKKLLEAYPAIVTAKDMTVEQALVQADTMTIEVKTALLERLLTDLGYSMNEVA